MQHPNATSPADARHALPPRADLPSQRRPLLRALLIAVATAIPLALALALAVTATDTSAASGSAGPATGHLDAPALGARLPRT